ncbi:MAG TPA: hypothetical protein VFC78_16465 [Tepidisphaeraceae bacterium]|nr:hypothetical protein [Tepidisphaeraceae bacterium]
MPQIPPIFERQLDFDPQGDFEAFARQAPPRWVVYLLCDGDDRPVQLLCVKNLRYSLKRRLGEPDQEQQTPSRRVNYRELVRRVYWRRVDSAFEADWLFYEAARAVFPQTYKAMIGFRPAWFIHVDPDAPFPRHVKTIDLSPRPGALIGPVEDKHAAARLIELIEDAFDLCRYYHILTQAPAASACAYKEMGKCPAPCDGSISIEQYRRMVEWSARTLIDPAEYLREQNTRMQSAAGELRFEIAARIKSHIDQISRLGKGSFRHAARLEDFSYLCFQRGPGPRAGNAKVFLVTRGQIEELLGLIDEPRPSEILRVALLRAQERASGIMDETGARRIGIVAHHLFAPKQRQGVFLRLDSINENAIARAWRDLKKQSAARLETETETESEGAMKEMTADRVTL